jgi:hypothetical protein
VRAQLLGGLPGELDVEVADRHFHALAHERAGRLQADAARAAGDGGDLAGEDAGLLGHVRAVLLRRDLTERRNPS